MPGNKTLKEKKWGDSVKELENHTERVLMARAGEILAKEIMKSLDYNPWNNKVNIHESILI